MNTNSSKGHRKVPTSLREAQGRSERASYCGQDKPVDSTAPLHGGRDRRCALGCRAEVNGRNLVASTGSTGRAWSPSWDGPGAGPDASRWGTLRVRAPQLPPSGVSTDGPSRKTSQISKTWEDRNSERNWGVPLTPSVGVHLPRRPSCLTSAELGPTGGVNIWSKAGQTPFPGDVCWTGIGCLSI